MIISKFKKIAIIFLIVCSFPVIIGCQQKWEFSILNINNPSYPEFCFSTYANCIGRGVSFSVFDVFEVNDEGQQANKMWVIQPKYDSVLKKIKYGEVPEGWVEVSQAKPLKLNTLYVVRGYYYFRIIKEADKIITEKYSVLDLPK